MLNQELTRLYKQIILDNRLYDTGALHRSIQVHADLSGKTLAIHVYCEDYIKFHIDSYNLNEQFLNNTQFGVEISKIYRPYFEQQALKIVNGEDFDLNVKTTIAYN